MQKCLNECVGGSGEHGLWQMLEHLRLHLHYLYIS